MSVLAELISVVLGVILSIALEIVPGLKDWWETWEWKRATWLVGCFFVSFAILGLAYAGAPVGIEPPADFIFGGLFIAVRAALAVYFGGQLTYAVTRGDLPRHNGG